MGSYSCGCLPGYTFQPPAACTAVNTPPEEPPTLLLANSANVQHVSLEGRSVLVVARPV